MVNPDEIQHDNSLPW